MAARHPPCRALKPKEKDYKVTDRDGMYVHVTAKGAMSFRMDCQPMSWLRSTMQPAETRRALVRRVTRTRARPKSADAASAANSPPSDSRRQRGVPGPHYR